MDLLAHPLVEVVKESAGNFLWAGTLWSVLGGLFGFLAALGVYLLARRLGWMRWERPVARWFRWSFLLVLMLVLSTSFAIIGFFEGVLKASVKSLRQGQLAALYYPAMGGAGADLLAGIYFHVAAGDDPAIPPATPSEELLTRFRDGRLQPQAAGLGERIQRFSQGYLDELTAVVKTETQKRFSFLREGRGEGVLDWFLENLGEALVETTVTERLEESGWSQPLQGSVERLFASLPAVAAQGGDPQRLSREELAGAIIDQTLIAGTLAVIRGTCRSHQIAVLVFPLLALLPLSFFPLARRLWPAKPPPAPPTPPSV